MGMYRANSPNNDQRSGLMIARGPKMVKDRISELPDEILCCMLLFLPMKEAVRSSILSHRWRYIWKTSLYFLSRLTLDVLSMRGNNYSNDMFGVFEDGRFMEDSNLLSIEQLNFVKWVDQMLQLDYSPVIDTFTLRFYLNKDFAHHIDGWISVAISKRVQNLDINLSHFILQGIGFPNSTLYKFPDWLFTKEMGSMVKSLCLSCCILRPLDFNCFSSLLVMKLDHVVIKQDSFDSLLPNCPNLEKLHLVQCWKLVCLKISGSLLKLKDLAVVHCTISGSIEIDAMNLTRFEHWGKVVNISFLNAPRLSTVIIQFTNDGDSSGMNFVLQNLASHVPKLEFFMPTMFCRKNPFIALQLANLKELVLMVIVKDTGSLWGVVPLLHASPLLDTLALSWSVFSLYKDCKEFQKPCDYPLNNLKNIRIYGYWSSPHEVDFATYLLKNATAVRKISIFHRKLIRYSYWRGYFMMPRYGGSGVDDERMKLEEQSKEQLMQVVHPGAEILFM